MTIQMPRLIQMPSPNYSRRLITHRKFVLHLEEGNGPGSAAYLCLASTRASAHYCMMDPNGDEVAQLVPAQFEAWAECAFNAESLSLEAPGFTAQGVAPETLDAMAKIAAWNMIEYDIPFIWAKGGQGAGYCSHHDLGQAGGGHVDFCGIGDATFKDFESRLLKWRDAFMAEGSLPVWGLHGLPNPRSVVPPPSVTPEPSHNGADRSNPGDVRDHGTKSNFPHGSMCDLQFRLNEAGAQPILEVDGRYGPKTKNAIIAFQSFHALDVDGICGRETWTALDSVTA